MLKIIDLHASTHVQGEYIVLENQGLNSLNLKGYVLCTESLLTSNLQRLPEEIFVFQEEIYLKPFMRVVLFTGRGENSWVPTVDGKQAYCVYWNRGSSVWNQHSDVHLLHIAATRHVQSEAIALSA